MLRRIDIAIDCNDVELMAEFWAAALGYEPFGSFEQYRSLTAPKEFSGPKLVLQGVDEPKSVKDRIHLDLVVADVDKEVERLVELGASKMQNGEFVEPELAVGHVARPRGQRVLRVF